MEKKKRSNLSTVLVGTVHSAALCNARTIDLLAHRRHNHAALNELGQMCPRALQIPHDCFAKATEIVTTIPPRFITGSIPQIPKP
eukprot:996955-Amphidinium_carterae.1